MCCECGSREAATTDGRFCRPCLKAVVERLSPGWVGHHRHRTSDQRQDTGREPSPWQETAVRALEDG